MILSKDKMILYSFFLNRFSFQKLIRNRLFSLSLVDYSVWNRLRQGETTVVVHLTAYSSFHSGEIQGIVYGGN
ncbi:hypothetical protein PCCS19_53200 [Paenibacillus sp. CCS19]|nr:hypothetical protein PCCS19_53200 [Paenibacillus cellulosilyticus]